jgi:tetratricopeptide (TPR) repeat protein
VGPTIPTCKLALLAGLAVLPFPALASKAPPAEQYVAARIAEISHENNEALAIFLKLYKLSPDSPILADRIFATAIRSGDMSSAVRAVRVQELNGAVSSEAPLLLFADAFRQKKWSIASLAVDELSARSTFSFMAPLLRAWLSVAQDEAYELPVTSDDAMFDYYATDQRVYLLLATGQIAKAKLGLRNMALVGGDPMRDLYLMAAPLVAASGDKSFSEALLGTALGSDNTRTPEAAPTRGRSLRLTSEQGLSALHNRIASALLEQQITEPALTLARIASWYDPGNEAARLTTAKALLEVGDNKAALALFDSVAVTSPYWPNAIASKVATLQAQGNAEGASQIASEASATAPTSLPLATLAAQTRQMGGQWAEAVAQYRQIVARSEKGGYSPRQQADFRLLLASSLDSSGNWDEAKKELEAALILDPNNARALNYLGYALLERNEEPVRAAQLVATAYKLQPDSAAITDSMGWVHFQQGRINEAVLLLEEAAKASGNDPAINEHLGDAYWQAGRRRDGKWPPR